MAAIHDLDAEAVMDYVRRQQEHSETSHKEHLDGADPHGADEGGPGLEELAEAFHSLRNPARKNERDIS